MRTLPLLLLAAACGGKAAAPSTPPSNESATYGDETGWQEYDSLGYGGVTNPEPYGYDDGYGGDVYGGIEGGVVGTYTPPPPPPPPDISGTWKTACTGQAIWTVVNTATTWDVTIASYGDAACTTRKSLLHLAGTYTIGAQLAAGWEGEFTWTTREYTADDKKTAKAFGKDCGVKKVKPGQTVSIHEKGCAKRGWKAAADCPIDHDLVAIEGDALRFGMRPTDNDLCTTDKRPTALDTTVSIAYQWPTIGIPECDAAVASYVKYMKCPMVATVAGNLFDQIKQIIPALQSGGVDVCKQVNDAIAQGITAMGC